MQFSYPLFIEKYIFFLVLIFLCIFLIKDTGKQNLTNKKSFTPPNYKEITITPIPSMFSLTLKEKNLAMKGKNIFRNHYRKKIIRRKKSTKFHKLPISSNLKIPPKPSILPFILEGIVEKNNEKIAIFKIRENNKCVEVKENDFIKDWEILEIFSDGVSIFHRDSKKTLHLFIKK